MVEFKEVPTQFKTKHDAIYNKHSGDAQSEAINAEQLNKLSNNLCLIAMNTYDIIDLFTDIQTDNEGLLFNLEDIKRSN